MKRIQYASTLFFYDGPQIIEARDAIGGHYVGLATPHNGIADRYVLAGVDPERLRRFRSGGLDLRSLLLESDEETRYIATARTNLDQPLALENLKVSLKDSGLLPDAGFFLHDSPTGDFVLKEARERNNLILEIAAEPPEAATQHRIRANTLAEMLFRVQAMVRHAYRAAMKEALVRNRRPNDYMMDVVVPAAAGSFRIVLEAADMPNLFGHSALGMALQKIDALFRNTGDPEGARAAARESRGHLAGAYLKLLRFLDERRTGFRYSWAEPSSERPGRGAVSHAQAASLVEALSSVTDLGVEAVKLEGTFEKFNRGTGAWGLLTAEGPRSGRMQEGSVDLDGLEVGRRYVFHCDEVIEEVDFTGRELRTLYLHRHEIA